MQTTLQRSARRVGLNAPTLAALIELDPRHPLPARYFHPKVVSALTTRRLAYAVVSRHGHKVLVLSSPKGIATLAASTEV